MILDAKSIKFDVPKHAGIEQTQYIYDYSAVSYCRNSPPEVFFEKGVLKTCSKFTGEHPC